MLSLLRRRRAVALTVALASLALPAAAHADLVQSPPTNITGGSFDDHSIGGDNHQGWGYSGPNGTSDNEPLAVNFTSTLTNAGATTFRVCGYASGTAGWMAAYQQTGATCTGSPSGTPAGWFRYVAANRSDDTPRAFNRWHLMDLQRYALVPVPGSTGRAIAWDNDWGTCLADNSPYLECNQSINAGSLSVSIGAATTKITQDAPGTPDNTRIGIPSESRGLFPAGQYQLVAISNARNTFAGASNVACTSITISGYDTNPENPAVVQGGQPATCYVPASLQAALTGPGGRDPLGGEIASTCTLQTTNPNTAGHCWADIPGSPTNPATAANPLARTNATAANVVDTSGALVAVPQGGALTAVTGVIGVAPDSPVTPAKVSAKVPVAAKKTLTTTRSKTYVKSAVAKLFGKKITKLSVSACKVASTTSSRCTVSFKKAGYTYKGHVWLRIKTVKAKPRWQYRTEVKKSRKGHKTVAVKRSYKTGGTF